MLVSDRVADWKIDVYLLEVVVVDVGQSISVRMISTMHGYWGGWPQNPWYPSWLQKPGYLAWCCCSVVDESCQLMNEEGDDLPVDNDVSISIGCGCWTPSCCRYVSWCAAPGLTDEANSGVIANELDADVDDGCPGHNWCDASILPLDLVIGVNGAPMGLMDNVVDVCLVVDLKDIPDDASPDEDEALPDGCASGWVLDPMLTCWWGRGWLS